MWLERFIIVVVSLSRDFLDFFVGPVLPTKWDWMTFAGTIGLFLTAMWLVRAYLAHDFHLRKCARVLPESHAHEPAEVKQ